MRNPALRNALRNFALEAAALLTDDHLAGAELEFDVEEEPRGRGPALYRYRVLTDRYIDERWARATALPSYAAAAEALGSGAQAYLKGSGLRGAQAEPALRAMLGRLYEDATSFGFPEERFERLYGEVEQTLYEGTVHATILAPVHGLRLEHPRVDLADGMLLARGENWDAPPEAVWPETGRDGEPAALVVLERDTAVDQPLSALEAHERFSGLVRALRLYKPGGLALGGLAWRRATEGRWVPLELGESGHPRGEPWTLSADEEPELADFLKAIDGAPLEGPVSFALTRFEIGCTRATPAEALPDYLLSLRALLDVTTAETGRASLGPRLAALCAEDGDRQGVQRRVERALSLERYVMSGGEGHAHLHELVGAESPRAIVDELEGHLRALLRDVICGHLDANLKRVADEILVEGGEPPEIQVRDLRAIADPPEPAQAPRFSASTRAPEPDTTEIEALEERLVRGVTPSADWDEEAESYSAPV